MKQWLRALKSKAVFACALGMISPAGLTHDRQMRWSPSEDLSHYSGLKGDASGGGSTAFPAYLNAALQSPNYREGTRRASESACNAWVAVQVINAYSSMYAYTFHAPEAASSSGDSRAVSAVSAVSLVRGVEDLARRARQK